MCVKFYLYSHMYDSFSHNNDFLIHLETGVQKICDDETRNDDVSADFDWVSD